MTYLDAARRGNVTLGRTPGPGVTVSCADLTNVWGMIITKHGNNPVFPLSLSGPELFTAQTIEARCYYHNNRPLINFATTSNMPPSRSFVRLGLGLTTAQKTCTLFRAGMRVTWVLSQQERERRFTKLKVKNEGEMQTSKKMSIGRSLNPCFTIEEKALLEDVNTYFEYPWLEQFITFDSIAALNWVEYTFCGGRLDGRTWQKMGESMFQNYTNIVMPKFPELKEIPAADFYYLCLHSGHVVNFFRSCFAVQLPSSDSYDGIRPYLNSIQLQVSTLSRFYLSIAPEGLCLEIILIWKGDHFIYAFS